MNIFIFIDLFYFIFIETKKHKQTQTNIKRNQTMDTSTDLFKIYSLGEVLGQ